MHFEPLQLACAPPLLEQVFCARPLVTYIVVTRIARIEKARRSFAFMSESSFVECYCGFYVVRPTEASGALQVGEYNPLWRGRLAVPLARDTAFSHLCKSTLSCSMESSEAGYR